MTSYNFHIYRRNGNQFLSATINSQIKQIVRFIFIIRPSSIHHPPHPPILRVSSSIYARPRSRGETNRIRRRPNVWHWTTLNGWDEWDVDIIPWLNLRTTQYPQSQCVDVNEFDNVKSLRKIMGSFKAIEERETRPGPCPLTQLYSVQRRRGPGDDS